MPPAIRSTPKGITGPCVVETHGPMAQDPCARTLAWSTSVLVRNGRTMHGQFVDTGNTLPRCRSGWKPPNPRSAVGIRTPASSCLGHSEHADLPGIERIRLIPSIPGPIQAFGGGSQNCPGCCRTPSPYWLRYTCASHSLDRGAPVHVVQKTLGHASPVTTSRYTHASPGQSAEPTWPDRPAARSNNRG